MEIKLTRFPSESGHTKGVMTLPGGVTFNTVEDAVREVTGKPVTDWKKPGITAIQRGKYRVVLTRSQRFGKVLPELLNVPGFTGIRIHSGNTAADTEGCIIPGMLSTVTGVAASREAMSKLQPLIAAAIARGEQVWITIE